MFKHSTKLMMVGLATAAALASAGCHKTPQDQGSAQVSVHALSLANDVKAVDVAVSGTGLSSPMDMPLFKVNGVWQALVSHIPVSTAGTTFTAKAYDSTAKTHQIYGGAVSGVTIVKNNIATVQIVLTEMVDPGNGFVNHAPVISSLVVSSTSVLYGDNVFYSLVASDSDTADLGRLSFATTVTCGSFGAPNIIQVNPSTQQFNAVWTAPATGTSCQLNMTVTDTKGAKAVASVTIALGAGGDTGAARISTVSQSYPVITSISASPDPTTAGSPTTITMVSSMSDSEPATYAWTSADCGANFLDATVQSPVYNLPSTSTAKTCTFAVVVSGPAKTDSAGVVHPSLTTAGSITVNVGSTIGTSAGAGAPVIDLTSQSSETVKAGETATLLVKAHALGTATIASYGWSLPTGSVSSLSGQSNAGDASSSTITFTGGSPMPPTTLVTVVVTDSNGSTASFSFTIISGDNPCAGAGSDGVQCDDGNGCTTGDHCSAGACVGTAVSCTALDMCHDVGTCAPSTGVCSNPTKADGTTCTDGNGCTQIDVCAGGACQGSSPVVCSALDTCHTAGQCAPSTGLCSNPAKADGVACNADNSLCTPADSCQAGVCTADTAHAVVCPAPGVCHTQGTCVASTGLCTDPVAATGSSCSDNNACTGDGVTNDGCNATGQCVAGAAVTCTASDVCHVAGACDPVLGCNGASGLKSCPWGTSCSIADNGNCDATCPAPKYAKKYAVPSTGGLAVDGSGNQYLGATMATSADFGTGTLTSAGGADIVLAKLNPTDGSGTWSHVFGDGADQNLAGVAVSQNGTVAAIGDFMGALNMGGTAAAMSNPDSQLNHGFIVTTTNAGAGLWATQVDMKSGALLAIASNPARNEFVVCGYAAGLVTDLGTTGTAGNDTPTPLEDIWIAKFSASSSTPMWAKQIGALGSQLCSAVALDSDGVVFATGIYDGTPDLGGGALPAPGGQAVWVLKLASDGTYQASATFGVSGSAFQAVKSIAVDGSHNVAIAGNLKGSMTFGGTTLTSAGGTDGFVAKLNSSLVSQWARKWGDNKNQEAHGVAFSSVGDVVVVGFLTGTTTGLGSSSLVASSTAVADAYWAKFLGTDGTSVCAAIYGDVSSQIADLVAISSAATGAQRDMVNVAGQFNGNMNDSAHNPLGLALTASSASAFLIQLNP